LIENRLAEVLMKLKLGLAVIAFAATAASLAVAQEDIIKLR
jgi:hypothetical protein